MSPEMQKIMFALSFREPDEDTDWVRSMDTLMPESVRAWLAGKADMDLLSIFSDPVMHEHGIWHDWVDGVSTVVLDSELEAFLSVIDDLSSMEG